jgi:L-Ala-D/L-Glu epimerase
MPEASIQTLHLREPFRIAHGTSTTRQVLRVHEGGAVGEAPFVPYYDGDPEPALAWVQGAAGGKSTRATTLALDLLRLDQAGEPLWKVAERALGPGRAFGEIPVCRSLSIPTDLTEFAERVRETAQQFQVLKLKLGSGDLGHDEEVVRTARAAAPSATLFADVNGGWSVAAAVEMMGRLRDSGLALIEQPLHHHEELEAWKELKEISPGGAPPVYADESVCTAEDVRRYAGVVDGVNVKLLKAGTFGGAVEAIRAARRHGLRVLVGCMIESSIGITAAAHLAPWANLTDLDGHLYLTEDDFEGVTFDARGRIEMPERDGIGARPRR